MSRTRQHLAFGGVVVATAAVMALAGPASGPAIAVVFLGFLLLHLCGLSADDSAAAAASSKPSKPSSPSPGTRRDSTPTAGITAPLPGRASGGTADSEAAERRESPGARPGPAPERSRPPGSSRETRSAEESEWLHEQLAGDVDDISFLPPYASGSEEDSEDEEREWSPADEPSGDWHSPGEPGGPPRPGEEAAEAVESYRNVPIPRHFALGTVAIIRDLMKPGQVAQILLEQRRQPKRQFGQLAVEMDFLTAEQLRELLVAQQEGLFTDEEIQEARRRLRAFRAAEASSG